MGHGTGGPGGGEQGERVEGTLTNGGSQPGERTFAPRTPGSMTPEIGEGGRTSGHEAEGHGDGAQSRETDKRGVQDQSSENADQTGVAGGQGPEEGSGERPKAGQGDQDRPDSDYDDRGYG